MIIDLPMFVIVYDVVESIIVNNEKWLTLKKWWLIKLHLASLKLMIVSLRKERREKEVPQLLAHIP